MGYAWRGSFEGFDHLVNYLSLFTKKIPLPYAPAVGFIIHVALLYRLNSSTKIL